MKQVRYPLQPLIDYVTVAHEHDEKHWFYVPETGERRLAYRRIGELCGTTMEAIQRYASDGIPERTGDKIATHLGLHARILWPAEWLSIDNEDDVLAAMPSWNRKAAAKAIRLGEPYEHFYSTLVHPVPRVLRRTQQPA